MTQRYGVVPYYWSSLDMTAEAFRVLCALAGHADPREGGVAYPSQQTLANHVRLSRETVCRVLNDIAARFPKILRIIKRGRRCYYYLLELPTVIAMHDPDETNPRTAASRTPMCERHVTQASHQQTEQDNQESLPPRGRPKVVKIEVPEDWWPDTQMLADAQAARPDLNLMAVTRKFVAKSRAFGWRFTSPEEGYRWFVETEFPKEIQNERSERRSVSDSPKPSRSEARRARNYQRCGDILGTVPAG